MPPLLPQTGMKVPHIVLIKHAAHPAELVAANAHNRKVMGKKHTPTVVILREEHFAELLTVCKQAFGDAPTSIAGDMSDIPGQYWLLM